MQTLKGKNILIVSPESWGHIFVSKHHYSLSLQKNGNQVFFLNPPSDRWSVTETVEGVKVVNYSGFVTGLAKLPRFIRRFFFTRVYNQLLETTGVEFDVIWSFDNSVFYDFDFLSEGIFKVSHIVDLNMNFQLSRAARSADLCLCTTNLLKNKLKKYNENVHKINHGYSKSSLNEDVSLPGKSEIKVTYVGNLSMQYLDWKPLYEAVIVNTNIDFVFFGPNHDEVSIERNKTHNYKKILLEKENVFFLGKVEAKLIPVILNVSDVLVVSYQEVNHEDQANPHKMMEYLASGKPVVATYTGEYAHLDADIVYMSKSNDEWSEVLSHVLANLQEANDSSLVSKRKMIAYDNTIEKQIERIEKLINLHG